MKTAALTTLDRWTVGRWTPRPRTLGLWTLGLWTLVLLPGCALFRGGAPAEEKLREVRLLSYAAASVGTQIALQQSPTWRPRFDDAYDQLNQLVESKVITGTLLRNILASLPVKELKSDTARIAIEGATVLYDSLVGDQVNIEAQPYVLAAATGIRDGMKVALGR